MYGSSSQKAEGLELVCMACALAHGAINTKEMTYSDVDIMISFFLFLCLTNKMSLNFTKQKIKICVIQTNIWGPKKNNLDCFSVTADPDGRFWADQCNSVLLLFLYGLYCDTALGPHTSTP